MSIAASLRAAKALLNEKTWRKWEYFSAEGDTLCMCAHGAVQLIVNNSVRSAIATCLREQKGVLKASYAAKDEAEEVEAAQVAGEAAHDARLASCAAVVSEARLPGDNHWAMAPKLGHGAHYVMGLVGLTATFNDAEGTTLGDIYRKFDEAIALAERLEGAS
jgi:hypothetical protein